jgi:hypothetical protein
MTNTTTQHHLDDARQSGVSGLAPVPARARHQRRRLLRATIAAATTVVVAGGLAAGSAYAASSSATSAAPVRVNAQRAAVPSQYQLVCDLGSGGVSEIAAALEACLVPTRTQPFSLIAAISLPARVS